MTIVQKWGNSLAVRIPIPIARKAHFELGSPVELEVKDGDIIIRSAGKRKLSLAERLELFDPNIHEGEVMVTKPIGEEKL